MTQAPQDARSAAEMFQILRMKPFINRSCGAKSRAKRLSRSFANAALSVSDRRWRASVRNPAESFRDAGDFEAPVLAH